jgi:hypothetical protein
MCSMKALMLALVALTAITGCSSDDGRRQIIVGERPGEAGAGGSAGFGNPSGGNAGTVAAAGGDGIASSALSVLVQDAQEMTIEIVTLACAGDCADIEAVARGGNPPYTFEWEDGSADPKRRVCLEDSATLTVSASDTAIKTEEFSYEPRTVSEQVTAEVLDCTPTDPPPERGFCLDNPSFEGEPSLAESGLELPGWSVCSVTPDVNPLFASLPASDGETYLGVVGTSPTLAESAGAELCAPLPAGEPVAFEIDVAVSTYAGAPAELQLWGGSTSCAMDALLWTSPEITDTDTWHTFCASFTPDAELAHIALWPVPTTFAGAYVLIDNIRRTERCD